MTLPTPEHVAALSSALYLIGRLGDALMRAHARRDSWSKA